MFLKAVTVHYYLTQIYCAIPNELLRWIVSVKLTWRSCRVGPGGSSGCSKHPDSDYQNASSWHEVETGCFALCRRQCHEHAIATAARKGREAAGRSRCVAARTWQRRRHSVSTLWASFCSALHSDVKLTITHTKTLNTASKKE